jgi:hypothetical protein
VQPFTGSPYTSIQPDSKWTNSTHLGTEYAAILVSPGYRPQPLMGELPKKGGDILAIASRKGTQPEARDAPKRLHFSGYEWDIREVPSDRGGANKFFDARNAFTDSQGRLHLRIDKVSGEWKCAEVSLPRSLGYGSYSFVVQETSHLESPVVFSMLTWDDLAQDQNHRELDIEISRWGESGGKNAQYVVQPYYVAANVVRFNAPAGVLTYSFRWEPGKIVYRTVRGSSQVVSEHEFTSGIPTPGGESVHINLYFFEFGRSALQNGAEVVIEKFEYLP